MDYVLICGQDVRGSGHWLGDEFVGLCKRGYDADSVGAV